MSNFIPYGKQWIDDDDINEVVNVLKSDWITTGPKILEFERKICEYIGCNYAVAVNSGTSALDIAVQCLELPKGSEIITTPLTFVADSNAIIYNNLVPVFADIKGNTFNINPEDIRKKITEKTRAILYVDYAGQPCEIKEIKEIAEEHNLFLIEDACHALGAEYHGKRVGNFADVTVFSFHPVKHITTGEGGMVVTNNENLHKKICMLRNHGIDKSTMERFGEKASYVYDMKLLGRNYRMTDFQAALGISQLKKLESFIKRRQEIAKIYNEEFEDTPEITTPFVKPHVRHVWHIYTPLLNSIERDAFFERMRAKEIGVNVHYIPIYKHSFYKKNFSIDEKNFPVTEDVFRRIITLPIFPKMTNENIETVITSVKETINELKRR
jgi:UDP-4-amino-4,6-dideoxy-N-acetyl-beta-L-altrosamine transaminase